MRKLISGFVIALLFSMIGLSPGYAQERDLNKELYVYVLSDSLELPIPSLSVTSFGASSVKSKSLLSAFQESSVRKITKAFPNWNSQKISKRADGKEIKPPDFSRIFILQFDDEKERDKALDNLIKENSLLFVEKPSPMRLFVDDEYSLQWHLNNTGQTSGTQDADIDAPEAWAVFQGSSSVKIGIIDTGVEITHDDLSGKATGALPENNTGYDHGTHVAGIAAAKIGGGRTRGVDGNAQIVSKKIFSGITTASGYPEPAAESPESIANKIMDAVDEGCQILNNSYGSSGYNTTIRLAFAYAYMMNTVSIAAMGNTGTSIVRYPAAYGQGIIAVGSTDHNDLKASSSTMGSHIDVTAPGVQVYSTITSNSYGWKSGTSMATPVVSGIASLLKGYKPALYNDDIENIIKLSADKVQSLTGFSESYGYGRVNAKKALDYLRSPYVLNQYSATGGTDVSSTGLYSIALSGFAGSGMYLAKRHEVRRTVTYSALLEPNVWGRGVASNGWTLENPNFGTTFCGVVSGSITSTSAILYTYVYEVFDLAMHPLGWYPTTPANVVFAYTILGKPAPLSASMSGPTSIAFGTSGTWTANPSGGVPPYTYKWERRYDNVGPIEMSQPTGEYTADGGAVINLPPVGYWTTLSYTTQSINMTVTQSSPFSLRTTVTDSKGATAQTIKSVTVTGVSAAKENAANLAEEVSIMPEEFAISQNYPNPFNPSTSIQYDIKEGTHVLLKVYNTLGEEVETLVNEYKEAGRYTANFKAQDLPSGVYIYRISAGEFQFTRKMLFLK